MTVRVALGIVFVSLLWPSTLLQSQSQGGVSFRQENLTIKTRNKNIIFKIEVAETKRQRARGLMWRKHLAAGTGMLFDFRKTSPVVMWMKNTYIPLDIMYINRNGSIARIIKNSTPLSTYPLYSVSPVRAVLELLGGTAERQDIRVGDTVVHSIFKPESS